MNTILRDVMKDSIRNDLTEFDIGDTIRVGISIKDGDKQRIQYVEGIVIRKRNNKKEEMKIFQSQLMKTSP